MIDIDDLDYRLACAAHIKHEHRAYKVGRIIANMMLKCPGADHGGRRVLIEMIRKNLHQYYTFISHQAVETIVKTVGTLLPLDTSWYRYPWTLHQLEEYCSSHVGNAMYTYPRTNNSE